MENNVFLVIFHGRNKAPGLLIEFIYYLNLKQDLIDRLDPIKTPASDLCKLQMVTMVTVPSIIMFSRGFTGSL